MCFNALLVCSKGHFVVPLGGLVVQIHLLFHNRNAESMDRIAKLNTAQSELNIAKLGNQMAKIDEQNKEQMNIIKEQINENLNEKIDSFQNTVIVLTETIKIEEIKVSEHETKILALKDKVSHNEQLIDEISTNYVKQEEFGKLMDERLTSTSCVLSDMPIP